MTEPNNDKLRQLLRKTIAPVDSELKRDLWPQMLRRMEEPASQFGWLDWAMTGVLAVSLALFPEMIPLLLYYV